MRLAEKNDWNEGAEELRTLAYKPMLSVVGQIVGFSYKIVASSSYHHYHHLRRRTPFILVSLTTTRSQSHLPLHSTLTFTCSTVSLSLVKRNPASNAWDVLSFNTLKSFILLVHHISIAPSSEATTTWKKLDGTEQSWVIGCSTYLRRGRRIESQPSGFIMELRSRTLLPWYSLDLLELRSNSDSMVLAATSLLRTVRLFARFLLV